MKARKLWILLVLLAGCGSSSSIPVDRGVDVYPPAGFRPLGKAHAREVAEGRAPLRVGLVVDADEVRLRASGRFVVVDADGQVAGEVRGAASLRVHAHGEGLRLVEAERGVWDLPARRIALRLRGDGHWTVGDDRFTGEMQVLRTPRGGVTLVEAVDLEHYLKGVVPWEIGRPRTDAFAAVEAQAIAARTYAYAHLGHWEELGFDVHADVRDQVYRGETGTADITDRAVGSTRHRVATHDDRLIRAYYSSTCGGHGATLTDVWTREGAPYLVGRPDRLDGRPACQASRHFRWRQVWSARELGEILRRTLPRELDPDLEPEEVGVLQSVRVARRDLSGRVQRLEIETDRHRFEVFGDRARWVLLPTEGPTEILRSTLFDLEEVRREGRLIGLRMRGGGFGHGVGLCQTGALERARHGQSAEEILRHYYTGIRVRDVRDLDLVAPQAR